MSTPLANFNMCGVLVHAVPQRATLVAEALKGLPGVEVHTIAEHGRIVVTVEDTDQALAIDQLSAIHRLDGVVAAALIYHQFEPADAASQAH